MTGQEDIFNIFKKQSYDDLKKALEEWLDPSTDGEVVGNLPWENKETTATATGVDTKTAVQSTTKSTDDISAAFDDLFNSK